MTDRAQLFEAVEATLTEEGVQQFRSEIADAVAHGDADEVVAAWVLTAALMSDPDGRELYETQASLPAPDGDDGLTSEELWDAGQDGVKGDPDVEVLMDMVHYMRVSSGRPRRTLAAVLAAAMLRKAAETWPPPLADAARHVATALEEMT